MVKRGARGTPPPRCWGRRGQPHRQPPPGQREELERGAHFQGEDRSQGKEKLTLQARTLSPAADWQPRAIEARRPSVIQEPGRVYKHQHIADR
ncbi:hypothetical protein EYF80_001647 [Liparis tanakae]|uniref:Uncharacterized protein n=1 Tax=Liparis tanakae TaxID=230148 RepID=A0A4Z2JCW7_9TELE|nr:hypothetical protein EYF80_001647 [Liparis tanakae]